MNEIHDFLTSNGYSLIECGDFYRTKALYRNGKGLNLTIHKTKGHFKDWVSGASGSFKDLVALITGAEVTDEKLKELLARVEAAPAPVEKIKVMTKLDPSILDTLLPDYSFYLRRGISEETQKLFKIGLCTSGKLRNRYVVPVFCHKTGALIGLTGRYYKDDSGDKAKWMHQCPTKEFLWPMHLNDAIIREKKEIIITESAGDTLALWEMGKKNTICLFTTAASPKVINYICGIYGLKKVWIALNNDAAKNSAGNNAAEKLRKKLLGFFSEEAVQIVYPPGGANDWSDYFRVKNGLTVN